MWHYQSRSDIPNKITTLGPRDLIFGIWNVKRTKTHDTIPLLTYPIIIMLEPCFSKSVVYCEEPKTWCLQYNIGCGEYGSYSRWSHDGKKSPPVIQRNWRDVCFLLEYAACTYHPSVGLVGDAATLPPVMKRNRDAWRALLHMIIHIPIRPETESRWQNNKSPPAMQRNWRRAWCMLLNVSPIRCSHDGKTNPPCDENEKPTRGVMYSTAYCSTYPFTQ